LISLVIHGGAWDIPDTEVGAHRAGCSAAVDTGWDVLKRGGSAVDAVEQAIRCMEDDLTFDAGRGSHLNSDGEVELDASIMDGRMLRCGAVAAVHRVPNPITLARSVMENSEHILLVGGGAEMFAARFGVELCEPEDLVIERELSRWKEFQGREGYATRDAFHRKHPGDTVGAVALDSDGCICVGTSTGGTMNKTPGRVGDSPLIGCGSYSDNEIGGVSTTGWGEAMIKVVMAKTVIDMLEANGGDPAAAAEKGIQLLRRKVDGFGGVIVMNTQGRIGIAFNTPRMARAYMHSGLSQPVVAV
jgi:beta-aspartyl-peptidase (threonine type)